MDYYWGVTREESGAASDDSVDGMVVKGLAYILEFGCLFQI